MTEVKKPEKEWAYDEMLADYDAGLGNWFEVTPEFYWQALEVLPPIYMPLGFFVGEPQRHLENGSVLYAAFCRIHHSSFEQNDRFFARYSTRKTWLADYQELRHALALSPLDGGIVHKLEVLEAKYGE